MGEDRLNISTAIDLFNYCYRKREGKLDNFAIYIRLHKDSNLKLVKKIINYYKVDNNEYIRVFGTYESIFIGSTVAKYHVKQRAEEFYSDYTILGTYNQFDTNYGFKLVDFNIDCSEGCKINNLPSSIQLPMVPPQTSPAPS